MVWSVDIDLDARNLERPDRHTNMVLALFEVVLSTRLTIRCSLSKEKRDDNLNDVMKMLLKGERE